MCTLSKPIGTILVLLGISLFSQVAQAKYGGGSGTAEDPYQIASTEDLIALGETPEDYDKHFILTADIDLGGHVFDKAVIAPDTDKWADWFQGTPFTGVFDGSGYTIAHMMVVGRGAPCCWPKAMNLRSLGAEPTKSWNAGAYVMEALAPTISLKNRSLRKPDEPHF